VPPLTPILPLYGVPTVPAGGELRTRTPTAGLMVIETGPVVMLAGLDESETCSVIVLVPATVGVPDTVQLLARDKPAGSDPPVCTQS
jgi:hypothetical protein